jgi:hypothetical protein
MKIRKPRGIGKDGFINLDLDDELGTFYGDAMSDSPANRKIKSRLRNGLCMGCGKLKNQCICKSKLQKL